MERDSPHGRGLRRDGIGFPLVWRARPQRARRSGTAGGRNNPYVAAQLALTRAYERDETLQLVRSLGMTPVVPPKANRKTECDFELRACERGNRNERPFRRLNDCRRIFTRLEKLDMICFAPVVEVIRR